MKTNLLSPLFLVLLLLASAFSFKKPGADKLMMEQICASRPALKEVLMQAGLSPLLMDNGPYTFFAPSDAALTKYKNSDPGKLKDALMNHIVAGRLLQADFKDGSKISTMGGKDISVFRKGDEILINGIRVSEPDLAVKNGVIHTVDTWLVAPN